MFLFVNCQKNKESPTNGETVCVFYYCRTCYKAVRVGGRESGGHVVRETTSRGLCSGTREEPGTLTQGAPVFPGSSRLGIEPKTPGWLVQDPTTRPIGDLIPTIGGSGAHPWRGKNTGENERCVCLCVFITVFVWLRVYYCCYKAVRGGEWRLGSFSQNREWYRTF